MKGFFNLFKLNSIITIRSGFHYAVIGIAILFIVLVNFVIPEEINITPEEFFFDNTSDKYFEKILQSSGTEDLQIFQNYESFMEALENTRGSTGIIADNNNGKINFEIISRSNISSETINIIKAALEYMVSGMTGLQGLPDTLDSQSLQNPQDLQTSQESQDFQNPQDSQDLQSIQSQQISQDSQDPRSQYTIEFEYLREKTEPAPFNKNFIPIFITFEVVMLGFILIAVSVFQEKDEGSIRAYRISPGGTMQYIWSKVLVITIIGLLYGIFTTLFTAGLNVDYLSLIAIIILSSLFINFLGLFLSIFFRNISEFLIVSVFTMTIIQLPTVSYFNPGFSPSYLRWMPSYPILFGVREAIFRTGKENFMIPVLIILLAETAAAFLVCYFGVKLKLIRSRGKI